MMVMQATAVTDAEAETEGVRDVSSKVAYATVLDSAAREGRSVVGGSMRRSTR